MSVKLSAASLSALPAGVVAPQYRRSDLSPGIVHIGVGNFHRAHQAVYLDDLNNPLIPLPSLVQVGSACELTGVSCVRPTTVNVNYLGAGQHILVIQAYQLWGGTFGAMYLMGYSLDNLSLMALTLTVGFVVDDAIVMLENIVRHMEMGKPPYQAAV